MASKLALLMMVGLILTSCKEEDQKTKDLVQGYTATNSNSSPGYALKIISWDSTVLEQYKGVEDVNSGQKISSQSLFNIGSISKTFVAYAILNLASDQKLSLSDSIIKYFPDFKNKEIGKKVRIYHLLTHSSGLPDNRHPYQDSVYYLTADDAQNWAPILTNDSLEFEPGSRYNYSNPAFNALALIIQQVTGLKWQDYIKIKIFSISGMKSSTITDGSHPSSGVSHAYLPIGNTWTERDFGEEPTFNAAGNGGVWSNVDELYLYEKAIRSNLFVEAEVNLLSRNIYPLTNWTDSIPSHMGLSWVISKLNGHTVYSHTGSQGGFTSDFVSIPEEGFFYCILSNVPLEIMDTRRNVLAHALDRGWIKKK